MSLPLGVMLGDTLGLTLLLAVCEGVGVPELVALPVFELVGVPDGEFDGVGELEIDDVVVAVGENEGDGVPLALPPVLSVGEGVAVLVVERLVVEVLESLPLGVCEEVSEAVPLTVPDLELVGVALAVIDAVGLAEMLTVDVIEGVTEEVAVLLADPPALNVVVGLELTVDDKLVELDALCVVVGDCDGVDAAVPVPVLVIELVGVWETLAEGVVLAVPESDPVEEGLAPSVIEAVGVRETDFDKL